RNWYPMSPNDPYPPPQGGQYIPPPPPYEASSDVPPESPYPGSPAPQQGSRGLVGWLASAALAVWAVVKYGLLLVVKVPALATLLTGVVSVWAYTLLFPWQVAIGLVVLIFVHEMGHVLEIRRQGLAATAPISKWIQVAGLAILAGLFFAGLINPLVLIVVAIGMPMVYRRFREPDYDAYLTSGPASARLAIGATWLALVVFLGVAFYQTEGMLQTFLR